MKALVGALNQEKGLLRDGKTSRKPWEPSLEALLRGGGGLLPQLRGPLPRGGVRPARPAHRPAAGRAEERCQVSCYFFLHLLRLFKIVHLRSHNFKGVMFALNWRQLL